MLSGWKNGWPNRRLRYYTLYRSKTRYVCLEIHADVLFIGMYPSATCCLAVIKKADSSSGCENRTLKL